MNTDPWQEKLTPEQYRVMREGDTEAPNSGSLVKNTATGDYCCAACGEKLFESSTKFESTTPGLIGWPAFSEVVSNESVVLKEDTSLGMRRTEVTCRKCGSHLGHLFEDPSSPNGQHYCINSVALDFKKSSSENDT